MEFQALYPILGFENEKKYILEQIDDMFYKLKGDNVEFTLINPFTIRKDYDFEVNGEFAEKLNLQKGNILVLNILTLQNPFLETTVNFAAPVILNLKDKLLGQAVLDKYDYSLAKPLKDFIKVENEN